MIPGTWSYQNNRGFGAERIYNNHIFHSNTPHDWYIRRRSQLGNWTNTTPFHPNLHNNTNTPSLNEIGSINPFQATYKPPPSSKDKNKDMSSNRHEETEKETEKQKTKEKQEQNEKEKEKAFNLLLVQENQKIKLQLRAFEKAFERWRNEISKEIRTMRTEIFLLKHPTTPAYDDSKVNTTTMMTTTNKRGLRRSVSFPNLKKTSHMTKKINSCLRFTTPTSHEDTSSPKSPLTEEDRYVLNTLMVTSFVVQPEVHQALNETDKNTNKNTNKITMESLNNHGWYNTDDPNQRIINNSHF